jgi:hypothetical protein
MMTAPDESVIRPEMVALSVWAPQTQETDKITPNPNAAVNKHDTSFGERM